MKRMTRGLPLCAAVLAMMTACGGNGSDGKEGMPMRQKIEQLDRQLTVGMTENSVDEMKFTIHPTKLRSCQMILVQMYVNFFIPQ